jgi:hypothetical protein
VTFTVAMSSYRPLHVQGHFILLTELQQARKHEHAHAGRWIRVLQVTVGGRAISQWFENFLESLTEAAMRRHDGGLDIYISLCITQTFIPYSHFIK